MRARVLIERPAPWALLVTLLLCLPSSLLALRLERDEARRVAGALVVAYARALARAEAAEAAKAACRGTRP